LRQTASVYNKDGLLDVWNLHLTDLGARIIESRHKSVDKIREKLALQDHFFAPETINIRYAGCNEISSKATLVDLREQLFKKLSENRAKEIGLGRSLVEPYRGEILLDIDEKVRSEVCLCWTTKKFFDRQLFGTNGSDNYGEYPALLIRN